MSLNGLTKEELNVQSIILWAKKYGGLGIVTYDDAMPKTGHAVQRAGARGQGGSSQIIILPKTM